MWVRPWIVRRPQMGLYHRLMVELRNEDPSSFHNFMRMPAAMFDELVARLTPRLTKATTNCRQPLEPGLKVALTLRHLASGAKYRDMQYAWRVPHNTISLVVREVCYAILEEYAEEQLSPPPLKKVGWSSQKPGTDDGTSPTSLVLLMGSMWRARLLQIVGQTTTTTRGSLVSSSLPWCRLTTSSSGLTSVAWVLPQMLTYTTTVSSNRGWRITTSEAGPHLDHYRMTPRMYRISWLGTMHSACART